MMTFSFALLTLLPKKHFLEPNTLKNFKIAFISRCSGTESARAIRELIGKSLYRFVKSIEDLNFLFNVVTDCASTMPAIFESSVSLNRDF